MVPRLVSSVVVPFAIVPSEPQTDALSPHIARSVRGSSTRESRRLLTFLDVAVSTRSRLLSRFPGGSLLSRSQGSRSSSCRSLSALGLTSWGRGEGTGPRSSLSTLAEAARDPTPRRAIMDMHPLFFPRVHGHAPCGLPARTRCGVASRYPPLSISATSPRLQTTTSSRVLQRRMTFACTKRSYTAAMRCSASAAGSCVSAVARSPPSAPCAASAAAARALSWNCLNSSGCM